MIYYAAGNESEAIQNWELLQKHQVKMLTSFFFFFYQYKQQQKGDKSWTWSIDDDKESPIYTVLYPWSRSRVKKCLDKWSFNKKTTLFLDSGAYTMFTQAGKQNVVYQIKKNPKKLVRDWKKYYIREYIKFVNEFSSYYDIYANLDVIRDPETTLKNQTFLESKGLSPLPCIHTGEPLKYLYHYMDNYDYIALGGAALARKSLKELIKWYDRCFSILCNDKGIPRVKVHGFGVTILRVLLRYPWYSVDSTTWNVIGRSGSILVPVANRQGNWAYNKTPWQVAVSSRSPEQKKKGGLGKSFVGNLPPRQKDTVLRYIHEKGYKLGKSKFKEVSEKHEPKEKEERWYGPPLGNGKRMLEIYEEKGLCNGLGHRQELCLLFFLDLCNTLPGWPWAFKEKAIIPRNLGLWDEV